MLGKAALFTTIREKWRLAILIGKWIEIFAGIALEVLGLLFLGTNI